MPDTPESTPEQPARTDEAQQPVEQQPEAAEETRQRPVLPEDITAVEETDLRALYEALGEWRTALREGDRTPQAAADAQRTVEEQRRIADEIERRRAEARQADEQFREIDAMEIPSLPEAEPALASPTAAQIAAAQNPQDGVVQAPPPARPERPVQPILAAAGLRNANAGDPLDWTQLGAAIDSAKLGPEGKVVLASLPPFPEGPDAGPFPQALSRRNDLTINDELIHQAREDWLDRWHGREPSRARTAAICEPFDIIRDIPDAFETARPVANIFPQRPAGRGGYQFTPSGVLADVVGGVTIWDEDDQAAVDVTNSATLKPCVEYICPTAQSAVLEWIPACVTFDNTLEMSNPERVQNLNNALAALRSRIWEGRVLQRIDQLSHGYAFSGDYGALPSVIEAVNTVVAQLTYANRETLGRYVLVVPPGVPQVLTIDRANRAYGVERDEGDVMAYLQANLDGVGSVVRSLDASLGGEPSLPFAGLGAVNNQDAGHAINYLSGGVFRFRLVAPEAAIYSETGEMNAGVLRDSTLTRANKTGYFTEAGFFLTKHGPQPWATIDIHLCADGARAGLVEPNGCTAS